MKKKIIVKCRLCDFQIIAGPYSTEEIVKYAAQSMGDLIILHSVENHSETFMDLQNENDVLFIATAVSGNNDG